jgi:predicted O-linked N-acetylglucosamine transferase (SPINDLY family)
MSAQAEGGATALRRARELHRLGQLAPAIAAYAEALVADPANAEAWRLKAMAEHQAGNLAAALESVSRARATGGDDAGMLLIEGNVLQDQGALAQAAERFARVAAEKPEWVAGHVALGQVRMDQGQPAAALEAFRAAVAADPTHVRSWNNVGVVLHALDRPDEALGAYERALALDPGYALAHLNLARVQNRRDSKAALRHAEAAAKAEPRLAEAWLLIGEIQRRNLDAAKAAAAINAAIQRAPQNPATWISRAELFMEMGRIEESRAEFTAIAARFPQNVRAAYGANLLLPRVYDSAAHLEASRAGFAAGLERLHDTAPRFEFATPEAALVETSWNNFFLAYQGRDDRELQVRFAGLQRRLVEPRVPELLRARKAPRGARVRVGFLSHYFFNSVVGRYFSSWVMRLDRERFDTVVYYTNEWMANDTRAIESAAGTFRHVAGRPLQSIARQVIADELDVLVYPEIGMHPETQTLAGLRLAPVQCAGWGHPTTTGSPEMDWFISCEGMEPPGGEAHYSEKLALLPGLGTHYSMPQADAGGTRADVGLAENQNLYLVPQSLFKIHPDNDDLIAAVMERDPAGIAVMFSSSHEPLTQAFTRRLGAAFARRGMDIAERARFLTPNLRHGAYLRLNQLCDVMLDTLHWSGGNTSLDALASGLPLVTLPGRMMRGRQSQAMLRMMDLGELVASDAQDYVEKAVAVGADRVRRQTLAKKIAAGRGAVFERDEPVRALEDFLERAAR